MNELERRLKESLEEVRDSGRFGEDSRRAAAKERMFARMRRRRMYGFAGGAVLAGAAAVGAFVFFTASTTTRPDPAPDIGPVKIPGPARAVVDVGEGPTVLSVGGLRYVWSVNSEGNSVSRIDPETNQEILEAELDSRPSDIGIGRGPVWVALPEEGSIVEVDTSGRVVRTVPISDQPVTDIDLSVGAGAVWAVVADGYVARIDPETLAVERFELAPQPTDVAVKGDLVRVLDAGGSIYQLDAATGAEVAEPLVVEPHPAGDLTFAAGSLWYFAEGGDEVVRIDPDSGQVLGRVEPEGTVVDFVIDPEVAWILTAGDDTDGETSYLLTAVDRDTTEAVGDPIPVEGEPAAMVIAGRSLWLSLTAEDVVLRFSKYR